MTTTADDARADVYMSRYAREQGVSEDTARVMYALNGADCLNREDVALCCWALRLHGRALVNGLAGIYYDADVSLYTLAATCKALVKEGGDYDRILREIVEAWG